MFFFSNLFSTWQRISILIESNIDSLERPLQNSTCTWRRASIESIAQEPENSSILCEKTVEKNHQRQSKMEVLLGYFGMVPGFVTRMTSSGKPKDSPTHLPLELGGREPTSQVSGQKIYTFLTWDFPPKNS